VNTFARDLRAAGATGMITPDLIPDEAAEWIAASDEHRIDRTFLVSPSSTDERIAMTLAQCRGFVYATALMGVTGARTAVSSQAPELVARIRALARRAGRARPPVLRHEDLELDPGRREAHRDGELLDLTPKEFGVLEALMSAGGQAVSTEALLERVWDEHADPFTNTVRMCVMTLRRKLGDPPVIKTVTGVGYRI
jgi:hypothetical protein